MKSRNSSKKERKENEYCKTEIGEASQSDIIQHSNVLLHMS